MTSGGESSFNLAQTAGLYSTLAGVLAGFAFAALILLITARLTSPGANVEAFAHAAQVLLAAFVGLVLTSLNYAILAGERYSGGRAASEMLVASVGFAASGVLLLYALAVTLDTADKSVGAATSPLARVAARLRALAALFVTPLLVFYAQIGAEDYRAVHSGPDTALNLFGWGLVALQALLSAGLWWWHRRPAVARRIARRGASEEGLATVLSFAGLIVVVLSTAVFGLLTALLDEPTEAAPPIVMAVAMLVNAALMAAATWIFARRPTEVIP